MAQILGHYKKAYPGGSTTSEFFLNDNLGSLRVVLNSSFAMTDRFTYTPWGEVKAYSSDANKYLASFTGKKYDATGLIYFNARYYDAVTGRFVTEDPSRNNLGWYNYCNNDPINMRDSDGKEPQFSEEWWIEQNKHFSNMWNQTREYWQNDPKNRSPDYPNMHLEPYKSDSSTAWAWRNDIIVPKIEQTKEIEAIQESFVFDAMESSDRLSSKIDNIDISSYLNTDISKVAKLNIRDKGKWFMQYLSLMRTALPESINLIDSSSKIPAEILASKGITKEQMAQYLPLVKSELKQGEMDLAKIVDPYLKAAPIVKWWYEMSAGAYFNKEMKKISNEKVSK
jgi:RHS repeat-associated protein